MPSHFFFLLPAPADTQNTESFHENKELNGSSCIPRWDLEQLMQKVLEAGRTDVVLGYRCSSIGWGVRMHIPLGLVLQILFSGIHALIHLTVSRMCMPGWIWAWRVCKNFWQWTCIPSLFSSPSVRKMPRKSSEYCHFDDLQFSLAELLSNYF